MFKIHFVFLFCLTVATMLTLGCNSSSDPRSHHVQGTVTFKGAPVLLGDIQFVPANGNSGPPGNAKIVDGKFDTSLPGGRGTIGGSHTVVINGFDGIPQLEKELPCGLPLFANYKVDFDVPEDGEATTAFNVTRKR